MVIKYWVLKITQEFGKNVATSQDSDSRVQNGELGFHGKSLYVILRKVNPLQNFTTCREYCYLQMSLWAITDKLSNLQRIGSKYR